MKNFNFKSYCGKSCEDCATFKATLTDDIEEKRRMANRWKTEFGILLKAEEIKCFGCLSEGDQLFKIVQKCKVRKRILAWYNEKRQRDVNAVKKQDLQSRATE